MTTSYFETETWLPRSRDEVFEFFSRAENLQEITPSWLHFKILSPQPITIRKGTRIDYELKLFGIRFRWNTEITEWTPPHEFVDVQLRGPYRVWVHRHRFSEKDGGTLMQDEVNYLPKGGVFAPLIDKMFVRRNVQQIFAFRAKKLDHMFAAL